MKCQYCGGDLPKYPQEAVEEDTIDEVVVHVEDGDSPPTVAQRSYYCDLGCASEAVVGGDG